MPPGRPSFLQRLAAISESPRLLGVVLLSLSSALPLGLVWIAVPTWMTEVGLDIRVVGLFALAQAPWSFKFFWSPLVDRYPLPFLGRKRGWILLSQIALFGLSLAFALASSPGAIAVLSFATAFVSATQDIAIDAYTVEVLRPEEYGLAAGARAAAGRLGLFLTGGVSITVAGIWGWPVTHLALGALYVPLMLVTVLAPEPEVLPEPPKTLRAAIWEPFVGFLSQHRALEILAFVILYKLSDQLAQALISPFLIQMGFNTADVGVNSKLVGTFAILAGTFLGGLASQRLGIGRALWIFGIIQTTAHLGYAVLAGAGLNRPLMFAAHSFELGTSGLANGAFQVFLLRLTQKRFSATQYALFSSLFAIPRVLAGPAAGLLVDAFGWKDFFIFTVFTGIPGLVMLQRFVPWREREAVLVPAPLQTGEPLSRGSIVFRASVSGLVAWGGGVLVLGALSAAKTAQKGGLFDLAGAIHPLVFPGSALEWTSSLGAVLVGFTVGLGTAAALFIRRGLRSA